MLKARTKLLIVFLTCFTLFAAGCTAASTTTSTTISRQVPVTRGDLVVSVSVDGNLEMTDYYNLRFASTGEVKKVLVEEGDQVKQGQLLAYLDDTSARLDVKAANNSVQSSLSTMYETVPRLPQFPGVYYQAVTSVPIVTPSITQSTVIMWNTDNPPPPAIGVVVTPINTTTSSKSGLTTTVTTTVGSSTVTAVAGTIPGTTEVTTNVNVTNTRVST